MEPIPKNPVVPLDDNLEFPDPPGPAITERETSVLPTLALTSALELLTEELRRRENPGHKVKSNEPDTFDGSDSKKLNNFILLCNLYFRANPSSYSYDDAKVTFALSYLRGMALEYFEPALLDSELIPEWLGDWSEFTHVLRTEFGPIDPTADVTMG